MASDAKLSGAGFLSRQQWIVKCVVTQHKAEADKVYLRSWCQVAAAFMSFNISGEYVIRVWGVRKLSFPSYFAIWSDRCLAWGKVGCCYSLGPWLPASGIFLSGFCVLHSQSIWMEKSLYMLAFIMAPGLTLGLSLIQWPMSLPSLLVGGGDSEGLELPMTYDFYLCLYFMGGGVLIGWVTNVPFAYGVTGS